jgi:hypothetical protein
VASTLVTPPCVGFRPLCRPGTLQPIPFLQPPTDWFVAVYRVDEIASRVVVTQDVVYLRYHGARSQNWCVVPFCYCVSLSHTPNLVAICTTHARPRHTPQVHHPVLLDVESIRMDHPAVLSAQSSEAYRGLLGRRIPRTNWRAVRKRRRKSIQDHKRFLTHFGAIETLPHLSGNNDSFAVGNEIVERTAYASLLSESPRSGASSTLTPARPTDTAVLFTR